MDKVSVDFLHSRQGWKGQEWLVPPEETNAVFEQLITGLVGFNVLPLALGQKASLHGECSRRKGLFSVAVQTTSSMGFRESLNDSMFILENQCWG
ncbi:hypothetical protein EYF80_003118 [Liparis tanakae]|uniref:Uncharacterized protein n=1 Tax=Liparis tanakae TaxID=230148 RepID=A0A4Z2J972_9TELE|nr:hypothetical protein EYF80_003118 [Liparis tanakae]